MIVFPVARAGPIFQAAIKIGKFHGMICAQTPTLKKRDYQVSMQNDNAFLAAYRLMTSVDEKVTIHRNYFAMVLISPACQDNKII
jgi:hypothetical protein